jgi:hypothetical protein
VRKKKKKKDNVQIKINLLERPEIAKNDLSHKKLGNDPSWKGTGVKAGFSTCQV